MSLMVEKEKILKKTSRLSLKGVQRTIGWEATGTASFFLDIIKMLSSTPSYFYHKEKVKT